jgi:hypothetical protein
LFIGTCDVAVGVGIFEGVGVEVPDFPLLQAVINKPAANTSDTKYNIINLSFIVILSLL